MILKMDNICSLKSQTRGSKGVVAGGSNDGLAAAVVPSNLPDSNHLTQFRCILVQVCPCVPNLVYRCLNGGGSACGDEIQLGQTPS